MRITGNKSGVLGAMVVLGLGCTTSEGDDGDLPPDAVRIAALVDQTGTSASLAFSGAIKLAFKQMNEGLRASGQSGVQFRLLLRDTASQTQLAVKKAVEAVTVGGA